MTDIFDSTILCRKCKSPMKKAKIFRNGFEFRAVICPNEKCHEKIIHPLDQENYDKFKNLKNKEFNRLIPNIIFHLSPRYLLTIIKSKRKLNYLNQFKFLVQELINQKYSN